MLSYKYFNLWFFINKRHYKIEIIEILMMRFFWDTLYSCLFLSPLYFAITYLSVLHALQSEVSWNLSIPFTCHKKRWLVSVLISGNLSLWWVIGGLQNNLTSYFLLIIPDILSHLCQTGITNYNTIVCPFLLSHDTVYNMNVSAESAQTEFLWKRDVFVPVQYCDITFK